MKQNTQRMAESAVMIAIAAVLSVLSFRGIWALGGSLTVCSMLPLVMLAFRHGTRWGLMSALAYALVQLVLGLHNLQYAPNAAAVAGIVLLDYLLPFTLLGFSAALRPAFKNLRSAILAGIAVTFSGRFLCHFLSGWIIWEALFPNELNWASPLWSLAYNASYMVPEILITMAAAYLSYRPLERWWRGEGLGKRA